MKTLIKLWLIAALLSLTLVISSAQDTDNEMTLDSLVNIGETEEFDYLVGPEGMTLYSFSLDDELCTDECLTTWMPLTVENESELTKTEGIPGNLGIYQRENGASQVTYNDIPLYYFSGDEQPGDLNGDRVGNVWFIVQPVNLYVGRNDDLGKLLVGPTGMTVYISINDQPGISNCTGDCTQTWIPFRVDTDAALTPARNVPGQMGLIERPDDSTLQVTYNGQPLYFFVGDENVGDAIGQGADDSWYIYPPETVFLGGSDSVGLWLETAYRRTVYASQLDEPGVSNCVDACTETWIPYTVEAGDVIYGLGVRGELSVITRPDGSLQVAYNEMPLYTYIGDEHPGDINGYGIDGVWFNVPPETSRDDFMNFTTDPNGAGSDNSGG